ncbi:hypothetical protein [Pseudoalteromonas sp. MTN2-4]|uniref:hypothetical protein n=1 Tax=Pseudoalteromonas sp. MTN2-4 TaxID=3056555 RepID=UPI0036F1ED4E
MKLKLNKKTFKKLNLDKSHLPAQMTPRVGGAGGPLFTHLDEDDWGDSAKCDALCFIQLNPNG